MFSVCMGATRLGKSCGTTRLNRLDLVESKRGSVEAGGQVVAVKVVTLGRAYWAKLGASSTANAGLELDALAEGTKLLSMVTVGAEGGVGGSAGEGCGEGVGGGLGVRLTAVVDRRRNRALSNEANGRAALGVLSSLAEDSGGKHVGEVLFGVLALCWGDKRFRIWWWLAKLRVCRSTFFFFSSPHNDVCSGREFGSFGASNATNDFKGEKDRSKEEN